MTKPRIYVTRMLPQPGLDRLAEYFDCEMNHDDRVLSKQEIIDGIQGKDALLCLLTDTIDNEILDANPHLRVISNYAVGYNNIDVEAATAHGIPVCNTPGVLTETSADLAWALLMACARRIVESDRYVRAGNWQSWGPMLLLGSDVHGKTLGIVGMGRIGAAIARRAKGFNMRVLYHDLKRNLEIEKETGAEQVELDQLLQASDYVSLNITLTDDTTHLIGERELSLMKQTACLINTARGPVVCEKALLEALKQNQIAYAGLDVFEEEPRVTEGFMELENTVLLPHIASASWETRTKMAMIAAENAIAVFSGNEPYSIVNPEVLTSNKSQAVGI